MTVEAVRGGEAVRQFFVGRSHALEVFYSRFAYRHMKNGVYFHGPGGLGKTWILKKILVESEGDPTRLVPGIIDFFDTQNHSTRGLQDSIRQRLLAPEVFETYQMALNELRTARSESDGKHPSVIAGLEARADKIFVECCQQAVLGREIVLLFDTFERAQQRQSGRWLIKKFLPKVRNVVVAIAGRPEPAPADMPDNFVCYELGGLDLEDSMQYIHRWLPDASDAIIKTLWERTDGAPLIMQLILELPIDKRDAFINELTKLDGEQRVQTSPALQRRLVGQFSHPSDMMNKLIWTMTYLWRRFDVPMLEYMVKHLPEYLGSGDYHEILTQLTHLPYVKEYPTAESHLLHDEVKRMVRDFVHREAADSLRELRTRVLNLAINGYYPQAIEAADGQLECQLRAEQLGYVLDTDPSAGRARYEAYLNEIERTHNYDFEELLWGEMWEHLDAFGDEAYSICDERGEWLRKHSLFQGAEEHYRQTTSRFEQGQVNTQQALGFMLMRQGRLDEAKAAFEKSRELLGDNDHKGIGMIENNLGQVAERSGEWDKALEHYAFSFRAATLSHDYPIMASVYSNRGYLYALQGLHTQAMLQSRQALEILNSLPRNSDNDRRTVYAWMNLGTAYRYSGSYPEAAQHYRESLRFAQASADREAIADVLQNLGINAHQWGRDLRRQHAELSKACELQLEGWRHITDALEIAREADWRGSMADGTHRLAHVYREIYRLQNVPTEVLPGALPVDFQTALEILEREAGTYEFPLEVEYEQRLVAPGPTSHMSWLEKAGRLFEISAVIADETERFRRALDSLTEVAAILIELKRFEQVPLVVRHIERIKGYDYQEELFSAIGEIIFGDWHFEQERYTVALERYGTAYPRLARQTGYAAYLLGGRLRMLGWRMSRLPADMALEYCDALEMAWLERAPQAALPAMLGVLEQTRLNAVQSMGGPSETD